MTFQQRLIWTFVIVFIVNLIGYWVSAIFHVDISGGPDPSALVLGLIGLITTLWGTGEFAAAVRKRGNDNRKTTDDGDDGG